ncbi:hypothetical protein U1Q18_017162, partial [Sarracenia purpurea var. burkii]
LFYSHALQTPSLKKPKSETLIFLSKVYHLIISRVEESRVGEEAGFVEALFGGGDGVAVGAREHVGRFNRFARGRMS